MRRMPRPFWPAPSSPVRDRAQPVPYVSGTTGTSRWMIRLGLVVGGRGGRFVGGGAGSIDGRIEFGRAVATVVIG